MATSLGTAWIQIKPSLKGVSASIRSELDGSLGDSGTSIGTVFGNKWTIAAGGLISAGISKILGSVSRNIDTAIGRVDTLRNSQKVFEAMGYAGDAVSDSMSKLTSYLDGLPTSMTTAVNGVQSLAASFGGIEKGTDYFIAMNDAGLAFGSTTAMIENAIMQLGQTSLDGPLDAATWNSLRNSGFSPVFSAMAKEAGITVGELKEQFGAKGTKTVQDFLDELVRLDKEGTGSMSSLSELAKSNTEGIGTALENLQNRIGKAIAKIIEHIGPERISAFINGFSASLSGLADVIIGIMDFIGNNTWVITALAGAITPIIALGLANRLKSFMALFTPMNLKLTLVSAAISGIAVLAQVVIENWSGITAFFGDILGKVGNFFSNMWNNVVSGARGAWEGIKNIFGAVAGFFGSVFSNAWNAVKAVFSTGGAIFMGIVDGITNAFRNIVNAIIRGINSVVAIPFNAINGFLNTLRGIDILGFQPFGWIGNIWVPQIPTLATGGRVYGIGTATSDSNLAALSKGEYVIRAAAAREIGYDRLDQINDSGNVGGTIQNYFTIEGYNRDPRELAEEISGIIARQQKGVLS